MRRWVMRRLRSSVNVDGRVAVPRGRFGTFAPPEMVVLRERFRRGKAAIRLIDEVDGIMVVENASVSAMEVQYQVQDIS
jgi:hypothetical protein